MAEKQTREYSPQDALPVGAYLDYLNSELPQYGARIWGEVSSVSLGPTGHVYYTIKDETNEAALLCAIWARKYAISGVQLKAGRRVIVSGSPNIYVASGKLTFITDTIELAGEGALQKAYEELKKKLTAEGMFESARKRPLPFYPVKVGVITSLRSGAVIHDFENNLGKFGFQLLVADSRVEGKDAIHELLYAMRTLAKKDVETLVVMRGGGSFESLQAFNNEALVRAIAGFPVPVIAAIGHHKDAPLVNLAADVEASTPTAAAQILNRGWEQALSKTQSFERSIAHAFFGALSSKKVKLERAGGSIQRGFSSILAYFRESEQKIRSEVRELQRQAQRIHSNARQCATALSGMLVRRIIQRQDFVASSWHTKIVRIFEESLQKFHKGLPNFWTLRVSARLERTLRMRNMLLAKHEQAVAFNNPERQLRLGYALVHFDGQLVRSIMQLTQGSEIITSFSDGLVGSKVQSIKQK